MSGPLAGSEQVAHREMVVTIETPAGPLRAIGNPIKIAGETTTYAPPPLLGEHNARRARLGSSS